MLPTPHPRAFGDLPPPVSRPLPSRHLLQSSPHTVAPTRRARRSSCSSLGRSPRWLGPASPSLQARGSGSSSPFHHPAPVHSLSGSATKLTHVPLPGPQTSSRVTVSLKLGSELLTAVEVRPGLHGPSSSLTSHYA